jgi:preprotein translocase SecE subunit
MNRLLKPFKNIANYLVGIQAELKLMDWVKGKDLFKYTAVVVAYSAVLTVFIYIVDAILAAARSGLLGNTSL